MDRGATRFRVFRENDEAEILRFLNEISDAGCSLDEWAWLFPPEGGGRALVVGEREGTVTAVCAGAPLRVVMDGRELSGVALRKVASRDRDGADPVVDHFIETFGSAGRFALVMASFDFDGAVRARLSVLVRDRPVAAAPRRFFYRAEPARDWEPRLDTLWERVREAYPVAVVRDADRALERFAGHPSSSHHRFLVFPRFSGNAVASAVFADDGSSCRWLDLLWDHDHPGALELLAHVSGRLAAQWGSSREELWLAGDAAARARLMSRGFRVDASSAPVVVARSLIPDLDSEDFVDRAYLSAADVGEPGS